MHPLLLSSNVDPFQMAIIVIAVLAGFVKWLWESWQLKAGAAPPPPPPDPEEQRRREAAWRKQTGQSSAAPPPLPPKAAPTAWDELRKAWKELQETANPTQAPSRPVQMRPPPAQRQQQPARVPAPPPVATVAAVQAPALISTLPAVVMSRSSAPAGSMLANLRLLRQDPALMRQAILMQEILGPPKALQSSHDFAI
ncbi:hypothetical protein [Prosthecobacter sp.]|uniref:hypothetical protein n=1 Tax=Prosthecobacter sp. TaxID=1965333 RepID=UPI00248A0807|nr:hypothetical protein [Prosthecobacter sp.]MDI1315197.1 hypothetical protein [Prosthecobacter sp.]